MSLADLLSNHTFRMVLLGTTTIGLVAGALGSFAYLRKQSLISDVISHAAAYLSSSNLPTMLALTAIIAGTGALAGFGIAYVLNAATSAGMAVFYGLVFTIVLAATRIAQRHRHRHRHRHRKGTRRGEPPTIGMIQRVLEGPSGSAGGQTRPAGVSTDQGACRRLFDHGQVEALSDACTVADPLHGLMVRVSAYSQLRWGGNAG